MPDGARCRSVCRTGRYAGKPLRLLMSGRIIHKNRKRYGKSVCETVSRTHVGQEDNVCPRDSLPDGSMREIADKLNVTVQTVRNYFGGSNYEYGKNCGVHIEPGPDGGIVILDDTQIYDMAIEILEKQQKES